VSYKNIFGENEKLTREREGEEKKGCRGRGARKRMDKREGWKGRRKRRGKKRREKIIDILGEFVYAVTAAEGIILSSLFIGRKQR